MKCISRFCWNLRSPLGKLGLVSGMIHDLGLEQCLASRPSGAWTGHPRVVEESTSRVVTLGHPPGEGHEVVVTTTIATFQPLRHGWKTSILHTHISKSDMWGTRA